jgi:hypothetical protein
VRFALAAAVVIRRRRMRKDWLRTPQPKHGAQRNRKR